MLLNKQNFLKATPAVTRDTTQIPEATREKPGDFPLTERCGPIPLLCLQCNCLFPIKQVRILDLLDGTRESTPEIPHKSRRTLMSPQECEIARCSPNQLEMTPDSPALAPEQFPVPHHTRQVD